MTHDFVDGLLLQWQTEMPTVDFLPLGVFARLARYTSLTSRNIYANIDDFHLNETHFNMLAALRRVGAPYRMSPKELASAMLLTSGAMTYVIDQMEQAGNVKRLSDRHDRRRSHIMLTAAGKRRIEQALEAHLRMCERLLAPLAPKRRAQLTELLRELLLVVDPSDPD